MNDTKKVNEFMSKLDHPLKAEMEAVRAIIVQASSKIFGVLRDRVSLVRYFE